MPSDVSYNVLALHILYPTWEVIIFLGARYDTF